MVENEGDGRSWGEGEDRIFTYVEVFYEFLEVATASLYIVFLPGVHSLNTRPLHETTQKETTFWIRTEESYLASDRAKALMYV